MNHSDAIGMSATERYLLNELPPDVRDEFEEHFFGCEECATDLRLGAVMVNRMRRQLGEPGDTIAIDSLRKPQTAFWKTALLVGSLAATLLVVAYQNLVTYPHLKGELASADAPAIMTSVPLVNGMSRGDQVPSVLVAGHSPMMLSVDVPSDDRFSSYVISLYTPPEKLAWKLSVSPQQARDTLSIRVPAANVVEGSNTLLVQGIPSDSAESKPVDVVRYRFEVHLQK